MKHKLFLEDLKEDSRNVILLLLLLASLIMYFLLVDNPVGKRNPEPVFYETSTPAQYRDSGIVTAPQ